MPRIISRMRGNTLLTAICPEDSCDHELTDSAHMMREWSLGNGETGPTKVQAEQEAVQLYKSRRAREAQAETVISRTFR